MLPRNVCVAGNWTGRNGHGVAEGVNGSNGLLKLLGACLSRPVSGPTPPPASEKSADLDFPSPLLRQLTAQAADRSGRSERLVGDSLAFLASAETAPASEQVRRRRRPITRLHSLLQERCSVEVAIHQVGSQCNHKA
jgi:hypothetical protein